MNAAICPLCQQANHCAMAAGAPAASCWCMAQRLAPAALAQLAPAQRGLSCICPRCGQTVTESETPAPSATGAAPTAL